MPFVRAGYGEITFDGKLMNSANTTNDNLQSPLLA
jgi:hypothetical protein